VLCTNWLKVISLVAVFESVQVVARGGVRDKRRETAWIHTSLSCLQIYLLILNIHRLGVMITRVTHIYIKATTATCTYITVYVYIYFY